jgi:hypothetical protein
MKNAQAFSSHLLLSTDTRTWLHWRLSFCSHTAYLTHHITAQDVPTLFWQLFLALLMADCTPALNTDTQLKCCRAYSLHPPDLSPVVPCSRQCTSQASSVAQHAACLELVSTLQLKVLDLEQSANNSARTGQEQAAHISVCT